MLLGEDTATHSHATQRPNGSTIRSSLSLMFIATRSGSHLTDIAPHGSDFILYRIVISEACTRYKVSALGGHFTAFDGTANLYSATRLPNDEFQFTVDIAFDGFVRIELSVL